MPAQGSPLHAAPHALHVTGLLQRDRHAADPALQGRDPTQDLAAIHPAPAGGVEAAPVHGPGAAPVTLATAPAGTVIESTGMSPVTKIPARTGRRKDEGPTHP